MLTHQSKYSLLQLAERFDLELKGNPDHFVDGVGTLRAANNSQVSFLANPAYRAELDATQAGAVVLKAGDADCCPTNSLIARDPYLAYARIATLFAPSTRQEAGIHPAAFVHPSARLGKNVAVGPNAVIERDCEIGDACSIGPGSVIGRDSKLGAGCQIYANVTLYHQSHLGQRVIVHSGVVIGSDGFGLAFAGDHWEKVPQLGKVRIGDDCEIGAGSTIDRGAIGDTVLEEDVRTDNQVQIGHNVYVGAHTAMAAKAGIAGSTRVGRYCMLGGGCGIQGHIEIADHVTIAARSIAYYPITEAGSTWSALIPAQPITEWQRNLSRLRKLDQLARKVFKLERSRTDPTENDQ
ncbi:MAG: UDP-3-O-(3-hydroxymyristoyl)glucosamine N-acyltransferase [Xanthomonadales bacterium]|nr:UDP-3-O-(3-hydroxymyristoyl)glucosamine N-acyltransferase [Xanthomonadales bacterium]